MDLEIEELSNSDIVFRYDDIEIARYRADSEASKPHFSRITVPTGDAAGKNLVLTSPHDHRWHHGLFFCQKLVDGVNCWESEHLSPEERVYGLAQSDSFTVKRADEYAEITQEATWKSSLGESLLADTRNIRLHQPQDEGYLIEWEQNLSPIDRRRHLSSESYWGRYGGLSIRFARDLTDGDIRLASETNPEPNDDTTGPWCDYTSPLDGSPTAAPTAGVTVMNYPTNDTHYPHWFTRNEPFGLLTANPIWDRVVPVEPEESITWRWGIWVHQGKPDRTQIEAVYDEYLQRVDA